MGLSSCKLKEFFQKEEEKEESVSKSFKIKVPVTTSPAVKDDLIMYIKTNGITAAYEKADLFAEVSGTINDIEADNNKKITKNQTILRIDRERLLLDIKNTKLKLEKAKKEFEAWKTLGENGNDEQIRLRTGLTEYETALEKLKLDLDKTLVKAPFAGILADFDWNKNQKISAGNKIGAVYNLNKIRLKVEVLESEIGRIRENNQVIVSFPSIPEKLYYGKVQSVSPYVKSGSRTCEAEIILKNDGMIKAGMYADVKIAAEKYTDKILIYKDALLIRDGKKLVFAEEDGKAKWQYVKTEMENEKFIAVKSGVKENQAIIIDGNFSLAHDADVKISNKIPYNEIKKKF